MLQLDLVIDIKKKKNTIKQNINSQLKQITQIKYKQIRNSPCTAFCNLALQDVSS